VIGSKPFRAGFALNLRICPADLPVLQIWIFSGVAGAEVITFSWMYVERFILNTIRVAKFHF
jgi:hypothetical protein